MTDTPIAAVLRDLAALGPPGGPAPTDADLVGRFLAARDEAAFAALVGRYGRLVWAVCRRAGGTREDAEDAFQATFLVLVRDAGAVRRRAVGGWLVGVARRVAPRTWRAFRRTAVDGPPAAAVAAELGMTPRAVYCARRRVIAWPRQRAGERGPAAAAPGGPGSAPAPGFSAPSWNSHMHRPAAGHWYE